MTWDAAVEKWEDLVGSEEGFYLSHQVRNGKKTAILAAVNEASVDKNKGGIFNLTRDNLKRCLELDTSS